MFFHKNVITSDFYYHLDFYFVIGTIFFETKQNKTKQTTTQSQTSLKTKAANQGTE